MDQDNEQEIPEDEELEDSEEAYYYPEPVFRGKAVFCCQRCHLNWQAEKEARRSRLAAAKELLLKRYPQAQALEVHGGGTGYQVYASFKFGGTRRADWNSDEPETVSILQVDKEAFRQWRGQS